MRFCLFFLLGLMLAGCASVMDATSDGPIRQYSGSRTTGAAMDDEHIENITTVNIKKADQRLRASHFNVVSYNGVVLLVGQVPNEALRNKAAEVASNVKRVRQVQNALTVGPNISGGTRFADGWLTTKIKTKYLFNNDLSARRIKVITENGVVYLMGLVKQREGDLAARVAQQTGGTQRIVKAFEYVD